jgi:hypothetical protein
MNDRSEKCIGQPSVRTATVSEIRLGPGRSENGRPESGRPMPWIPIHGEWLGNAGFLVDAHVEIKVDTRRIVITAI